MSRRQIGSSHGAGTRAAAATAMDLVLRSGLTLENALEKVIATDVPPRDQSQVKALAFGALRWHHRYRLIIGELLDHPLRARDAILESLLSVGLFQLNDSRQPAYASVAATVAASRRLKRPRAAGLINAGLRRYQREEKELLAQALATAEGQYSHPRWLISRISEDWPEQWQEILIAALRHPPFWIRVNADRTAREDYQRRLEEETGVTVSTLAGFTSALCLDKPLPVSELPGFDQGMVSVQDAASQLAADMLAPEIGTRVLDACSAPGGKATHLLEKTGGELDLVAVDVDRDRLALLDENLGRLRYSAQLIHGDILRPDSWWDGRPFDRILLDAPCSATGVIRRHPDIKFLRRPADIDPMATRQNTMLENLWPMLKTGGRLLYATCSLLQEENDSVISAFLSRHSDAQEVRPLEGPVLGTARLQASHGYQLLPGETNTDGFYYALMERLPS